MVPRVERRRGYAERLPCITLIADAQFVDHRVRGLVAEPAAETVRVYPRA